MSNLQPNSKVLVVTKYDAGLKKDCSCLITCQNSNCDETILSILGNPEMVYIKFFWFF